MKIREIPRLQDPVTGEVYKSNENRPSEVFITGKNIHLLTIYSITKVTLQLGSPHNSSFQRFLLFSISHTTYRI